MREKIKPYTDEEINIIEKITTSDAIFPVEYRTGVDHTMQILRLIATIRELKRDVYYYRWDLREYGKELENLHERFKIIHANLEKKLIYQIQVNKIILDDIEKLKKENERLREECLDKLTKQAEDLDMGY